jgi:hypothetical protein
MCLAALSAVVGAAGPAQAQSWTVQRSLETNFESNDNYGLQPVSGGRANTLSVSGGFGAARQTESSATRAELGLSAVQVRGAARQERLDGRLVLGQSLSAPLDTLSLGLNAAQDQTTDTARTGADISLGRGRRRSGGTSVGWSHAFTERLSAGLQGSASRTSYAQNQADASSFQNAGASANLQYRWSETDSFTLNAGHSRYRTRDARNRSSTDDASLGWSRALSESSSVSLSVGGYRTETTAIQDVLACPLQFNLCVSGIVPYIVVQRAGQSSRSGLQFNASARQRLDERSDVSFSAARQQAPSGAGVVLRSESLSFTLNHAFTPETGASLSLSEVRSVFENAADPAKPRLSTVLAGASHALSPQLSARGTYQFSRSEARPGVVAKANSVSVALRYEWPRLELGR